MPGAATKSPLNPAAPHLAVLIGGLLVLLFGYELFNFSLSIDEELYNHVHRAGSVIQGRWTIALLSYLLPPMGGVPFVAPLLFCGGLGVSAWIGARLLFQNGHAQWTFAALSISSVLWPHVVEFNVISWSVGLGCALVTIAFLLARRTTVRHAIAAVVLLALAIGIYQSLLFWFVALACVHALSHALGAVPAEQGSRTSVGARLIRDGLIALAGLAAYLAVVWLSLRLLHLQMAYVQGFVRGGAFAAHPVAMVREALRSCLDWILGRHPAYLEYGTVLSALTIAGVIVAVVALLRQTSPRAARFAGAVALLAALGAGLAPVILGIGHIPSRAMISWVPVGAFFGGLAVARAGFLRSWLLGLLGAAVFVSIWINANLFYADHLARQRDALLAARIMARVDRMPMPSGGRVPLVIVGAAPVVQAGGFQALEVFGSSYFSYGPVTDPARVVAYLRTLGIDSFEPRGVADLALDAVMAIGSLPLWPADGSVAIVGGALVVKFGPLLDMSGPARARRVAPIAVTASSQTASGGAALASDGRLDTNWNAGRGAPAWIQFELDPAAPPSLLRLNATQLPHGPTVHEVYGGPSPDHLTLLRTLDGFTHDGDWLELKLEPAGLRFVRIVTTKSPSWIAWREIEFYR